MKRRIFALILAAVLSFGAMPSGARAAEEGGFIPIRTYEDQFSDVSAGDWYYETVKALYELGLTNGSGREDVFDPSGELTIAEVVTMASRLRSLYETGDSLSGRDAYGGDGGEWYQPYVLHLQALGSIGQEFEGRYDRPATRAEMAHVLAGALPQETLDPVNREAVASGYGRGRYIRDVKENTPYRDDILLLYDWGVAGGVDKKGSFQPGGRISRGEAAAMVARLAYGELRVALDWEILPLYSRKGWSMEEMVWSDGTFYASPGADEKEKIDADVRYMLAAGQRQITLEYPSGTVSKPFVDRILNVFLSAAREYVEQTYNSVTSLYYPGSGKVILTFSSSLYDESEIEYYREETMAYAIDVHDRMWAEGRITADMTEYEKAKVYFDWVCNHCRYDYGDNIMSHSGYQAFTTGLAVCDGYVAAYNLLLRLEDIDCGTWSTAKHIWTVAELDGKTYHIDPTWGDQTNGIDDRYFAMTKEFALGRF